MSAPPGPAYGPYQDREDTKHSPLLKSLAKISDQTWREFGDLMEIKDDVRRDALFGPLASAGVELGDYDRTVLGHLADRLEPSELAVLVGVIHRALNASPSEVDGG